MGSLGTGMFSSVPGVLLLFFMTDTLGIPAALATFVVMAPKVWDAVTDPLMGVISDRTRSTWGRRSPYLLAGAIAMAITFPLLFNVPGSFSAPQSAAYVFAMYILVATAFTLYQIPYVSLAAELSPVPDERTRLLVWRFFLVTGGIALGTVAAPILVASLGGGREGYGAMAVGLGLLCAVFMFVSFLSTFGVAQTGPSKPKPLLGQLRDVLANRPFRIIAGVFLLGQTGIGVSSAAIPYYVGNLLGEDESVTGLAFLVMLTGTVASLSVWAALARRFGKKRPLAAALSIFAASALTLFALGENPERVALVVIAFFAGAAFGGTQLLSFSMLTDVIQLDETTRGEASAGSYSGFWLVLDKLGPALGATFLGTLLSLGSYVESTQGEVVQPASALVAIRISLSLLPAGCALLALAGLAFYRLRESDLA